MASMLLSLKWRFCKCSHGGLKSIPNLTAVATFTKPPFQLKKYGCHFQFTKTICEPNFCETEISELLGCYGL